MKPLVWLVLFLPVCIIYREKKEVKEDISNGIYLVYIPIKLYKVQAILSGAASERNFPIKSDLGNMHNNFSATKIHRKWFLRVLQPQLSARI